MTTKEGPAEWRIIGETVPGASHLRAGIPNQDAVLQLRESGTSLPLILSVSDGHGSDKCFRSDRGSRFAVRKAVEILSEFLDQRRGAFDLAEIESEGKDWLAQEFVTRWTQVVEADLKRRPFTTEELETLEQKDGKRARSLVEANPLLAYGATSVTVAVEESFILFLQLGDGAILTVNETGEVTKPLPEDERLFANETTSLCSRDAQRDFRFHLQPLTDERPALILLSTDGYVNSFSDDAGFLKVGSDLLEMLRSDGFDFVNRSLSAWLEEATRVGSGDDTTVAIICRMDALKKASVEETFQSQPQEQEKTQAAAIGAGEKHEPAAEAETPVEQPEASPVAETK